MSPQNRTSLHGGRPHGQGGHMRQGHSVTAKRLKGTHRLRGHCHAPDQAGRIFLQDCPYRGRHANPAVRQRAESECPLTEKNCRWLIVCEWQELNNMSHQQVMVLTGIVGVISIGSFNALSHHTHHHWNTVLPTAHPDHPGIFPE